MSAVPVMIMGELKLFKSWEMLSTLVFGIENTADISAQKDSLN